MKFIFERNENLPEYMLMSLKTLSQSYKDNLSIKIEICNSNANVLLL